MSQANDERMGSTAPVSLSIFRYGESDAQRVQVSHDAHSLDSSISATWSHEECLNDGNTTADHT